ncbi:MAG: transglycosylase SLT domain-containing protein [Actinomycetota bacterium]|nr:transglycosylase SLT domain-containing protein [Acidimicrobiia bacterium]MDQ3294642.1 transglycosylase SLT domain-containing protein [Actinomycetota bacterium]
MKRTITRRIRTVTAFGLATMALGACTPEVYIDQVFGTQAAAAKSVAMCESTMNPGAVSPGGGNHGLFQINNVHRATFEQVTGQPWSAVYDPYWNAFFAKYLVDQSGWQPWSCRP